MQLGCRCLGKDTGLQAQYNPHPRKSHDLTPARKIADYLRRLCGNDGHSLDSHSRGEEKAFGLRSLTEQAGQQVRPLGCAGELPNDRWRRGLLGRQY